MKRFFSIGLVLALFITTIPCASAADVSADQAAPVTTISSEYEMAIKESYEWELKQATIGNPSTEPDPLETYEAAFWERAQLPVDTLLQYGYSEDEVQILKAYAQGQIPFETAAPLASASLSGTLSCGIHTTSKYVIQYNWTWDKVPTGLGEDAAVLGAYGINQQSQSISTIMSAYSASVTYRYLDNGHYRVESTDADYDTGAIVSRFETYKLDDLGHEYVWAKSGTISMTLIPVVGSVQFAAAKAYGEYGHAGKSHISIDATLRFNPATGLITAIFTANKEDAVITKLGKNLVTFYNNGDRVDEYP